jgi:hypothetical protein
MAWGENEIAMRATGGSANLQNADTCMNSLLGELYSLLSNKSELPAQEVMQITSPELRVV